MILYYLLLPITNGAYRLIRNINGDKIIIVAMEYIIENPKSIELKLSKLYTSFINLLTIAGG